ncbi:hypothetical protein HD806DRAFT_519060 [Xylariaceae sp. AK1471]|nr:hypothetical protein HD806DRAFT_519060 [Xylariaceae sp. AK1471]
MLALPRWVIAYLSNAWVSVLWFTENLAKEAIRQFDRERSLSKKPVDETIFDRLLMEDAQRQQKGKISKPLTFRELADENTGILNAGTEPAATMLSYATYFWLQFLYTGLVKESPRYMPLVSDRLPRMVPKGGLYVLATNETIPEGLAYAEMRLILANLFARYEVLPPTSTRVHEDMVWIDRVIVHSTRNLRIKVKTRDVTSV